ncbi:hypothetical protein BB560_004363 [Smittium megazygosporum]|uniref:NEDD8-activating enzyme E1 catalytic subunit n=1 Tax=Smittium megazygosporum TaxID=133381 RepID=A0A2T9Z9F6_9FUNG|nr:hypothetical protein BB560_004363 [Smittium megazygosporum]
MEPFYLSPSPFDPEFVPGESIADTISQAKVLVLGAGGLGCEILKDLVMSGFEDIHVIDMDTIDLSNLNRQFLFREKDIGQPKAIVASKAINSRMEKEVVTPHFCKIQDKDSEFYKQFLIVICGLDSIEARRWVSTTFINLVDDNDPFSLIPIIDGGTEGFKGQSRVIYPTISACHECSSEMSSGKKTYPICTITNTPRLPEHCIEYASVVLWPKFFPDKSFDTDNMDDMHWIESKSLEYASKYGISGISFSLVLGVLKNIIPAIASTNAVIAASCVNEAVKLVSGCNPVLNNYMLYVGDIGLYSHTFELENKPNCFVCGNKSATISVEKTILLADLIDILSNK